MVTAEYNIGRSPAYRNGDGFARLSTGTASGKKAFAAAQRPRNASAVVRPLPGDMQGINAWLMYTIGNYSGVSIVVDLVWLPDPIVFSSDPNAALIALMDVNNPLGLPDAPYDCVLTNTLVTSEKIPWMQFMQPVQPYGFIVVAAKPVIYSQPWQVRSAPAAAAGLLVAAQGCPVHPTECPVYHNDGRSSPLSGAHVELGACFHATGLAGLSGGLCLPGHPSCSH